MEQHRHMHKPLPPRIQFLARLLKKAMIALGVVAGALMIGSFGYHFTEGMPWLDATLNAAMILSGMGPVNVLETSAGKVFAIFYCLFSGVAFITMAAILFGPVAHRFLHRFHLELEAEEKPPQ
jgi:hypothetical protein